VGKKPVQVGAFRAGTLTNPYEEREKDLRPTASGTIGDPGTGRMFCGQAGPKCSDREPRTPVSRETNILTEQADGDNVVFCLMSPGFALLLHVHVDLVVPRTCTVVVVVPVL